MPPLNTHHGRPSNEGGDHSSSSALDAPPDDEKRSSKAGEAVTVDNADAEPSERPVKKMKRGKYISRACTSCQQRKIKCEGGDPCRQCLSKQLPCLSSGARGVGQQARRGSRTSVVQSGVDALQDSGDSSINRQILSRLDAVERHLNSMQPPSPEATRPPLNHVSPSSAKLQNALETDGQTFAGEITMAPSFPDDNDNDNDNSDRTSTATPGLHPDYSSPASSLGPRRPRGWFEGILIQHGVTIDEQQSRYYLQTFLDEVHPMYPLIHPPTLWETFDEMWQYPTLWGTTDTAEREHVRVSVALVCFCLALGRCSISSRITDPSGVHSSGWSLYSVGMSLLHDLLETSNTAAKSLLMLQVIYLFRLDANQKAARVHALTVSVAHTIGIHRQSTMDTMPAFYCQLYCRAWWVIYMVDRRIAIESGKPYLIQDSNIDTALPMDLSDEWMTRFAERSETLSELQQEVAAEIARDGAPSPIPYVAFMVRYSRVAGKAWEVMYGAKASISPAFATVEYVDTVIGRLVDSVPKNLRYDPGVSYQAQFATNLRWQTKQCIIFSTCCTYLRLLIRRPLLPSSKSVDLTGEDDIESSMQCACLAAKILTAHQSIKDDIIKYSFALSHYVTSSAMIMIGLISREPSSKRTYGALALAATQSLNIYCHKIWVSGKMIRCVSRLSRLVQRTLSANPLDNRSSPNDVRRGSSAGTQMHHYTPPADEQDTYQLLPNTGTSVMNAKDLGGILLDGGGCAPREQGSDVFSYSDAASTAAERPCENTTKNELMSASWVAGPSVDSRTSWVMSDFNFETLGERYGPYKATVPTLPGNEWLEFGSTADRDYGQAKLGLLGFNEDFSVDVEIDPTMMTLYDASSMDLDMLG
ncbi:hypothetical protein FZEAL_4087 [Fusarium zealandicum]|uniref:Zn(2)-C6 fungal-type domain-containing protein n=1 Tax=Fusarium zealandicum TaxID=1053134 RepID=A0A8H4UN27_9HYPO|nr:hypothetical protein FZEAL_4087 [Fusarium zealandicum]